MSAATRARNPKAAAVGATAACAVDRMLAVCCLA